MNDSQNQPATKGDLAALKDELLEAIRDSQTEVLRAFYGFTQTVEKRLNMPPNAA